MRKASHVAWDILLFIHLWMDKESQMILQTQNTASEARADILPVLELRCFLWAFNRISQRTRSLVWNHFVANVVICSKSKSATSTCVNCSRYTCEVIRQAMTKWFCETDLQIADWLQNWLSVCFTSSSPSSKGASDPGLTIQRLQYPPASSESCSVMYE